jgi:adenosylcobinamide-GDP ribazoletransferase
MHVINAFLIAVSMYSKIPVPQPEWKEENMKYIFCFFPWIGAWIGGCIYLWNYLCGFFQIGTFCKVIISAAIPLLVTGGIHVDGYVDTMDALHSYGSREKKLEILKDSHIGAFAMIMLIVYGMIFLGAFSEVLSDTLLKIVCGGFFLSRCLCGISVMSFPLAKKEGMLYSFAKNSHKKIVKAFLYLQSVGCIGVLCFWSVAAGLAVSVAAIAAFGYYFYLSRKEFGGITGDTAGYFILLCEKCVVVAAACIDIFIWRLG